MSLSCPHCGGAIVELVGANDDAKPTQSPTQNRRNPGATGQIAQGSEVQDQAPRKTYNKGYDQRFLDSFWVIYPLRRDKRKAQIAWRNAIKRLDANGLTQSDAIATVAAGAIRYRDDPNREPSFTKYAEGWLNGDCWDDDPLPFRLKPTPNGQRPDPPRAHGATADAQEIADLLERGRA